MLNVYNQELKLIKDFSKKLKKRMDERGLKNCDIVNRTGLSFYNLARYLKGDVFPSAANFCRLCIALECTMAEFWED